MDQEINATQNSSPEDTVIEINATQNSSTDDTVISAWDFLKEGDLCLKRGDYTGATNNYNRALEINPLLARIQRKIAYIDYLQQRLDQAEEKWENAWEKEWQK